MYQALKSPAQNEEENEKELRGDKLYRVDFDDINPHPGFAVGMFISWDDIADYFDLFERFGVLGQESESPQEFFEIAFNAVSEWSDIYKHDFGKAPNEDQTLKYENMILESLREHWSSKNILINRFTFADLVNDLNHFSHTGAKRPELFGNVPDPGKSVEYYLTELGINFTIYQPFMIPYTEMYYLLYDNLPEWNFDEIEVMDIIETLFAIQDEKGNNTEVKLENWSAKWVIPDPPTHRIKKMDLI